MIISGKSASGFEFTVESTDLESSELRRCMTTLMKAAKGKGDPTAALVAMSDLEDLLLPDGDGEEGESQRERLYAHLQAQNGHRPTDKEVMTELNSIITCARDRSPEVKKS